MLISDWSSDFCSSDLRPQGEDAVGDDQGGGWTGRDAVDHGDRYSRTGLRRPWGVRVATALTRLAAARHLLPQGGRGRGPTRSVGRVRGLEHNAEQQPVVDRGVYVAADRKRVV